MNAIQPLLFLLSQLIRIVMSFEFTRCLIWCARYGGLSFGQENTLIQSNESQIRYLLDRVASSLQIDPQLFKNLTTVDIGNVVEDMSDVLRRLVTRKNVKVSRL